MSTGYLVHSFDLFNVAHVDLIAVARERVTHLVVGVLPDADVLRLTGRPPVVPLDERREIVRHVRGVDAVVVHDPARVPAEAVVLTTFHGEGGEVLPAGRTSASAVLRRALRARSTEAAG